MLILVDFRCPQLNENQIIERVETIISYGFDEGLVRLPKSENDGLYNKVGIRTYNVNPSNKVGGGYYLATTNLENKLDKIIDLKIELKSTFTTEKLVELYNAIEDIEKMLC